MIFIIGGPCRTGKSTVARRLQEVVGVSPVPTDALVWMLQVAAPQLGVRHGTRSDKPERLFPFLRPFVDAYTAAGDTLVLEGDAVAPDQVFLLAKDREVRACFLGNCRPPAAWDHLEVNFASSMGPPLRQ